MNKYNTLLSPFTIKGKVLRNRVVQAPMSVNYADEQGFVTQAEIEHYGRRAKGGVSVVITENFVVHPLGRQFAKQTMISDKKFLPGLTKLAAEIKKHGALALVQIVHAGRYAGPWNEYEKQRRLAPSPVPFPLMQDKIAIPQEITREEIREVIRSFGEAAKLAKQAGFDGVHIHGAQGFLISEFLSPRMNLRTDEYGGSFENRIRFALEVVREVRNQAGDDFIIGFHLMSDELMKGGWNVQEAVRFAKILEDEGIDFLIPVVSTFESMKEASNQGLLNREKFQLSQALSVKEAVNIPVVLNGRLGGPEEAERLLREGKGDLIGLARPLFTDPDWVKKVMDGKEHEIISCSCEPSQCLRTQLQGSTCHAWPQELQMQGYYGY